MPEHYRPSSLVRERRYVSFCWGVFDLANLFPFSVTSWWRTPTRHKALGDAVEASQHLAGTAVDLVFDQGTAPPPGLFVAVAREYGLEAVWEGDHWHLEFRTEAVVT